LQPAVVGAPLGAPFNPPVLLVDAEPALALLAVALVAGLDRDLVALPPARSGDLRYVAGQVVHVCESREHAVGGGGDMLGVLVLHASLLSSPGRRPGPGRAYPA